MKFNSYDYFINQININPSKKNNNALIQENQRLSYKDIDFFVNEKYSVFFDFAKQKSRRCAILLKDSILSVILYYGLLKYDITPAFLNFSENLKSVVGILSVGNFDTLVVDKNKFGKNEISEIISQSNINSLFFSDGENIDLNFDKKINLFEKEGKFILYSSGSTGLPKGVLHNQEDMVPAAKIHAEEVIGLTSNDIVYSMSNLNYTFAFVNATMSPFYASASSIISYDTNAWQVIENINKHHPTVICGVPAMISMVLELSKIQKLDLSSVRLVLSAGEKLPVRLWENWYKEYSIPIIEGYGSVEMIANVISNRYNDYKLGSSGKITGSFIINENEDGELEVTGPTVSVNYIGKEKNNSKTYKTGDMFKKDSEGNYWYIGRKDNVFKFNGIWMNPHEIEENLENFEGIGYALVVNDNMQLTAFIVPDSVNKNLDKEYFKKLNLYIKTKLEHYKCPTKYVVVSEIPKNQNGKKIRKLISQNLWIKTILL